MHEELGLAIGAAGGPETIAETLAGLQALGFSKPERKHPNWWQQRPRPVDWTEVRHLFVATLMGPYHVTDDVLDLTTFAY